MSIPTRGYLDIAYDDIRKLNARIVYASITPYGEAGPEADRTSFDTTALWVRAGLMDLTADDDGVCLIWTINA